MFVSVLSPGFLAQHQEARALGAGKGVNWCKHILPVNALDFNAYRHQKHPFSSKIMFCVQQEAQTTSAFANGHPQTTFTPNKCTICYQIWNLCCADQEVFERSRPCFYLVGSWDSWQQSIDPMTNSQTRCHGHT